MVGYARSAYFYSLLSGFGMFVLGSTFVMYNAVMQLRHLDSVAIDYGAITWVTLGISFTIDGGCLLWSRVGRCHPSEYSYKICHSLRVRSFLGFDVFLQKQKQE